MLIAPHTHTHIHSLAPFHQFFQHTVSTLRMERCPKDQHSLARDVEVDLFCVVHSFFVPWRFQFRETNKATSHKTWTNVIFHQVPMVKLNCQNVVNYEMFIISVQKCSPLRVFETWNDDWWSRNRTMLATQPNPICIAIVPPCFNGSICNVE